jgi:hypothetical protein
MSVVTTDSAVVKAYGSMEWTKTSIAAKAAEAVEHVLAHEDALKAYVQVKAGQMYLKALEEGLKDAALANAANADSYSLFGAKVTTPSRTTYDYSSDGVWREIDEQITELKEQLKAREGLLASVAKIAETGGGAGFYDEQTGEQIAPPRIVSQKEVLTITLAK